MLEFRGHVCFCFGPRARSSGSQKRQRGYSSGISQTKRAVYIHTHTIEEKLVKKLNKQTMLFEITNFDVCISTCASRPLPLLPPPPVFAAPPPPSPPYTPPVYEAGSSISTGWRGRLGGGGCCRHGDASAGAGSAPGSSACHRHRLRLRDAYPAITGSISRRSGRSGEVRQATGNKQAAGSCLEGGGVAGVAGGGREDFFIGCLPY